MVRVQLKFASFILTISIAVGLLILAPPASAQIAIQSIATDPFQQTNAAATSTYCKASNTTNHHANVEPDSFSYGSTIVAAFQVGRIYDGGACAIGFATSTDNGATWTSGLVPGLTKYSGGTFARVTDAAVAYDAIHNVWLISSLVLTETGGVDGVAIYTSRSTDGGLHWGAPIITDNASASPDKNWIVCDNSPTSPYKGNCYTEWDDNGVGNTLYMSTSTDGGLSWGARKTNNAGVIGGQPVVRPDGTVIVPTANANETAIGAFHSSDGGASWSALTTIATIKHHRVAGSLREGPLPSAEIDGTGTVYVAWTDCRFRTSCKTNDIVLVHSTNSTGTTWSSISRIPIDGTNSGVDHFTPGLGVNRASSGASTQIGLTYYFYPNRSSLLSIGFIASNNAGSSWSTPLTVNLAGFSSSAVATTSQGRMFGDYISTSFDANNFAHGIFVAAGQPTSGTACSSTIDNCVEYVASFSQAVAPPAIATANDPVLYSGNGGSKAQSFWKIVNNNGIKHRD